MTHNELQDRIEKSAGRNLILSKSEYSWLKSEIEKTGLFWEYYPDGGIDLYAGLVIDVQGD